MEGLPKNKIRKELDYFEGKSVEMIIRRKIKRRTSQQNKVLWWYCTTIGDYTGDRKEKIKSMAQQEFLLEEEVNETTGRIFKFVRDTSDLSTVEFNKFLTDIQQWAAEEFGVVLPDPDPEHSQTKIQLP